MATVAENHNGITNEKCEEKEVSGKSTGGKFFNLLIGVTGSVAAIKIPLLIEKLRSSGLPLRIAMVGTPNAFHFFNPEVVQKYDVKIFTDEEEWSTWSKISDPVLHIELKKWADILLIAPLTANTLAKLSSGRCDNLLTCVARAWNFDKPLIYCPAMNTDMWNHPVTSESIKKLDSWGCTQVPVISKKLACGDVGYGAMAEVDTIVEYIRRTVMPKTESS